ncbi:MAG: Gldg family protein [Spirochaetes bacterium]|nr:Gldg family protein [Spirochaetota bacterium]
MKIKEILNLIKVFLIKRNRIILNLIIIMLVNLVGITLNFKCDLTRNNAYSLSEISKEVVSNLADPLTVKVFFSDNLPAPYNSVQRYLYDLMEEYAGAANNNFNYEIVDVEKEKDKVSDFGISPIQVKEIASDQLKFRNAYMGLTLVHGDLIEKLNSITEADGLEYRITTAVKKMTGKMSILSSLDHPIKITLYASSNLPISGNQNLEKKVADIVKKANEENYNKLEFHYVDSVKNNEALKIAEGYGVVKLKWPAMRTPEGQVVKSGEGLIGLVVEIDDKFEVIQLLSRSIFGQYMVGNMEGLKESLNKAIDNVINNNPSIGYAIGHDERNINDSEEGAGNFKSMLSDMYDLKDVDLSKDNIPEDINTLVINGPKSEYPEHELFKIDQFIMNGKSILFLVDSFQEIRDPQFSRFGGGRPFVLPINNGIDKLLSHYGVTVNKDIVLDQKCYKSTQQDLGSMDIYYVPLIQNEGLNKDNVITGSLKTMLWPKGSSVTVNQEIVKEMGIKDSILVASSDNSWLMQGRIDFMPFGMSPPADKSQMSKRNLAVLLEGQFESYFKGKAKPAEPAGKEKKAGMKDPAIKASEVIEKALKPAKIIVAGSSEISLSNIVEKDGKSLNAVFLHNALDYLSGDDKTPVMRSKGIDYNPLKDKGENIKIFIKLFNIAGLPICVILVGIIVWRMRERRKKRIMEDFSR